MILSPNKHAGTVGSRYIKTKTQKYIKIKCMISILKQKGQWTFSLLRPFYVLVQGSVHPSMGTIQPGQFHWIHS